MAEISRVVTIAAITEYAQKRAELQNRVQLPTHFRCNEVKYLRRKYFPSQVFGYIAPKVNRELNPIFMFNPFFERALFNGHSNEDCYQQKEDNKCKDSSTADGRNSEKHETFVVDSTATSCNNKSCCCNDKIEKPIQNEVKYLLLPGIRFSFVACHLPWSHRADVF